MASVTESKHLSELMANKSGTVDTQVIFLDIVKYSKRKSTVQKSVVERLQDDVKAALNETGGSFLDFVQANNINFRTDVIIVPAGDGVLIAFTFGGLQSAAITFAKNFLRRLQDSIVAEPCEKFSEQQWCNCHSHYRVRIGINEGKAIIYSDANGQVNLAGTCANEAARLMNKADASQILLGELSYINLIDLSDDPLIESKLVPVGTGKVKHDKEIQIYQYVGDGEAYISRDIPISMQIESEMREAYKKMGMPAFMKPDMNPTQLLNMTKAVGTAMDMLTGVLPQPIDGDQKRLK